DVPARRKGGIGASPSQILRENVQVRDFAKLLHQHLDRLLGANRLQMGDDLRADLLVGEGALRLDLQHLDEMPAERRLERFEETGGTRGEDGTGEFLRQSRARDPAKFGEVARLPDSARVTLAGGRHVTGGEDDLADADFGRLEETRSELAVFSLPVRLE